MDVINSMWMSPPRYRVTHVMQIACSAIDAIYKTNIHNASVTNSTTSKVSSFNCVAQQTNQHN